MIDNTQTRAAAAAGLALEQVAKAKDLRRFKRETRILYFLAIASAAGVLALYGRVSDIVTQQTHTQQRITAVQHEQAQAQKTFRGNALIGCNRQNIQNIALLDIGKIITAARAQTSISARVRRGATDYIAQVKRLDPALPTSKALIDLATVIGGDRGTPADAREIAHLEDDFLIESKLIEQPRNCDALYGPSPTSLTRGHPNP